MHDDDALELACTLCGETVRVTPAPATNAIGSPDLDARPPGAARAALPLRVQCCPSCGYCARDHTVETPGSREAVDEEEYVEVLDDDELPEKAREFLCLARLDGAAGRFDDAFWSTLSAAWIADDADDRDGAERCRALALAALRMARAAGRRVGPGPGVEAVVEVDLLRRMGEFADAERCIRRALDRRPDEVVDQLLRFQRDLVAARDRLPHQVSEALNPDA
ncbi:MAG: hypothetical protein ACK50I_12895 [Burkholderiales bacterium]